MLINMVKVVNSFKNIIYFLQICCFSLNLTKLIIIWNHQHFKFIKINVLDVELVLRLLQIISF